MAGYNGRGSQVQSNATAVNRQIQDQRIAINETNELGLSSDNIGLQTVSGMGISRNQTLSMFPSFDGQQIMKDSFEVFLADVPAMTHPDFATVFKPGTFRSNDQIINNAKVRRDDALDRPAIGLGPNLKAQDIKNVMAGTIVEEATVGTGLEGGRGFGVTDPEDKGLTMGSYLKDRYSVTSDVPSSLVTKGERDSVPGDPYRYNQ